MNRKTKAEQIRQQIDAFPILPATVSRIMHVTSSPESSADDLVQAMLPDQSLCFTVLKLANSVLYGRPQRIDSLPAAIMVLGFNEIQSIALIKAMNNSFKELNLITSAPVEQFWEHSFLTAMAAQHIAQHLRLASGSFFMAGLLHDIGKLVLLLIFEEEYPPEQWMAYFSTEERLSIEQNLFDHNHASIGGQLLRQWNFPINLLSAVEHHHQPANAKAPLEQFLANVVQLADLLSHFCIESEANRENNVTDGLQIFLPNLITCWRGMGMAWNDEHFTNWYRWLCDSREQSQAIMEIFAA